MTRSLATLRFLKVLMAACICLPLLLFIFASWLNYTAAFVNADERISRSVEVVHEHALRVFRSTELLLEAVDEIAGRLPDSAIVSGEEQLHIAIKRVSEPLHASSVWLFAADGLPLVTNFRFPAPKNFKNDDRDYFLAHVKPNSVTYVGSVVVPKVAGPPIFTISRRRYGAEFSGVIAAALQPAEFTDFYRAIADSPSSYYAMLRTDGAFLARFPALTTEGARLDDRSTMMQAIAAGSDSGLLSVVSQTDGVERRLGYKRLSGFPIYLIAGIERSAIISAWMRTMAAHLIFGLPATALMFAVILIALKRTERLHLEAGRREAAESALRQAQKIEALGQLTGGVAHDFNNLLTIILGNLRALERDLQGNPGITARISRALERATYGANRAASLTQRLLAFSRQQPLAPKILDVNRLLKDVGSLLRRTVGEAHELEVVEAAGVWPIEADEAELDSAILNLVLNARDAMPSGGKITVEASNSYLSESYTDKHLDLKPGQYVSIAVSDKGTGMTPQVVQKAFDPFYTTKPTGQGTGLGLSQVHGFVKQSGGHVVIYSELDQGTTVKMYFPRSHGVPAADQNGQSTAILKTGNGQRILVVEDDDDVRSFVHDSLKEMNYNVTVARSGIEALALVDKPEKFDLLITDVVMPGMNGRQLATEIEKRGLSNVLYMTGYSQNAVVHHGRLDPGVILLQKPFSREDLAARVASLLGRPRE